MMTYNGNDYGLYTMARDLRASASNVKLAARQMLNTLKVEGITKTPDGVLGPEQQVTSAPVGSTMKPDAARLPDGDVLLSWARATGTDSSGMPTGARREAITLDSDAPPPGG